MKDTMPAALTRIEAALRDIADARQGYATDVAATRRAIFDTYAADRGVEFAVQRADDLTAKIALDRLDVVACSRARTLGLGLMLDARVEGNYSTTGPEWTEALTADIERLVPASV